jgi:hypothetical protein
VGWTGGFEFRLAGARIRSHAWERPAIAGLVCLGTALFLVRRRAPPFLSRVCRALESRQAATVVALAAVAWTLVAGWSFSTRSAGGSDSSGYVSQARLLARGHLTDDNALGTRPPWPHAENTLAPLGYTPAPDRARFSPTYPPGLPLLMVPAFLLHPSAVYAVVPLCGAALVWWTFALGRRLGEPAAGAVAALLVSVSPTFLYQLVQPMSDVPVSAAWILALLLAHRATLASCALSGVAAGIAILIRPNLAPLAVLVLAAGALPRSPVSRWRRIAGAGLAIVPFAVSLGLIQGVRYGSPLASGYGSVDSLFAMANVAPNLARYPRWLAETHTPVIWLWLVAPAWIVRRRRGVTAAAPLFVLWLFCLAVVAAYLPYMYFQPQEWMYTRFLLPAIPLMWLLCAAMTVDALGRLTQVPRVAAGALLLAGVALFSLRAAHLRFAFELKDGERKYVLAGEYAASRLPRNAVVVSMQHSGSIRYYSGLPILRWDFVEPDSLDGAVAWLKANGRTPFAVVDEWEFEEMKQRYGPTHQVTLDRLVQVAQFDETVVYAIR